MAVITLTPPASPLLKPTTRLRDLFPSHRFPRIFNEHELSELPDTLRGVTDLFSVALNRGCHNVEKRVVWTSSTTFLMFYIHPYRLRLPRRDWNQSKLELGLYSRDFLHGGSRAILRIYSSEMSDALSCLDWLISLPDTHYYVDHVGSGVHTLDNSAAIAMPLCPLEHSHMEKLCRDRRRPCLRGFHSMEMTAAQCRSFVSCVFNQDINVNFENCSFQDGGESFVRTYRELCQTGAEPKLSILHFTKQIPFELEYWRLILNEDGIKRLAFQDVEFDTGSGRILAAANVRRVFIDGSNFEDGGAALSDAIQEGWGPHELNLLAHSDNNTHHAPFGSKENWARFFSALGGGANLKKLVLHVGVLSYIEVPELMEIFTRALRQNIGLEDLSLNTSKSREWERIFRAVTMHASLRRLYLFSGIYDHPSAGDKMRLTKVLKKTLMVNRQLDEVSYDTGHYDETEWKKEVAPRLKFNLYRKRFASFPRLGSNRAAIVGSALGHSRNDALLIWMIISQNQDVLGNRLESRKRKRTDTDT